MDSETFRRYGHETVDWVADYLRDIRSFPVMPRVAPGDIRTQLPEAAPEQGESMDAILDDFRRIILPGVTHWNHPAFFAYFPANHSGPSILGELLSAALGVNAMVWQSSPAATELEEVVLEWLRKMVRLPDNFRGAIQDSASTATLAALLCAREEKTRFRVNAGGFAAEKETRLRIYASGEAHSSVEKGVKIAGFGAENLVRIAVDHAYALDPADLERRIRADEQAGAVPCCIVATVGTTSSTAIDPLPAIAEIAARHGVWMHVDAALAGSAAILPEKRWILNGIEGADSFVFNPHKWLFTNFDCSAFFCRKPDVLVSTFAIDPEYLRTPMDRRVTNYRDWGIPLGRRFRALKLWFVLRNFGVQGLRERLREHLRLAEQFQHWVEDDPSFELLAPVPLNTICFRYRPRPDGAPLSEPELDSLNERLLRALNRTGRAYLTHTRLSGRYCLRLSVGQTQTQASDVRAVWQLVREQAAAQSSKGAKGGEAG